MELGTCKLCGEDGERHDGHIVPKFTYKRFITGKGGKFFNSTTDRFESHQFTLYLFCQKCENERLGGFDGAGADFLERFLKSPQARHAYGSVFRKWAISLSYRAILFDLDENPCHEKGVEPALRVWKSVLLDESINVGLYSQHVFLRHFGGHAPFQRVLEWDYFPGKGLTYCKIGPLVVFGVTKKPEWSRRDKEAAEVSMLRVGGGFLRRSGDYQAGINIPAAMKAVSDEKNIRILEGAASSKSQAKEYLETVSESMRLEAEERIRSHRRDHPLP